MERKSTCANLKADTTGNICVKVFWIWVSAMVREMF